MKLQVELKLFLLLIFTVVLLYKYCSPLIHQEASSFLKIEQGNNPIYIYVPRSMEKNVTTTTSRSTEEETTEINSLHVSLQLVKNNISNINTINPVAHISSTYPSKFENLWIEIDKKQRLVSSITDLYISAVIAIPY